MDKEIMDAYEIAKRDLRLNYRNRGVHAGATHFSNFWTRDFCFASFGMVKLEDYRTVRAAIDNYLHFQKQSGFVPFLVGTKYFLIKYALKLYTKSRVPMYGDYKSKSVVMDQNPLIIIAAHNYIEHSRNKMFAEEHYEKLKKAADWCIRRDTDNDFLIEEKHFANWADSVKKDGNVLYTNVCFYRAILDMSKLCRLLRKSKEAVEYADLARKIKHKINQDFWNGKYYIDWIDGPKRHDYFSTDGNLLAIIWGIADKKQARKIIEYMEEYKLDAPVPCKTNYPAYPRQFQSNIMRMIGLSDYHNYSLAWLWLGCVLAMAKKKAGMHESAEATLKSIAHTINKYDMVYEVYEPNGKPVNRLVYKSEKHFSWSAGMFIYAVSKVLGKKGIVTEK